MLAVRGLRHAHPGAAPIDFPDFEAPQGAVVRLLGPSGSGKSTLLALLAGLLRVQQGQAQVAGCELAGLGPRQLDAWRARHLGFVPQRLHLAEGLTVAQNLALPDLAAGRAADRARIAQVCERLGLQALQARRPGALSLGQAQRVAVARAVLHRPQVILADEPTAHLDDATAQATLALLAEAAAGEGATLVVATHDRRVAEAWPHALAWSLREVAP